MLPAGEKTPKGHRSENDSGKMRQRERERDTPPPQREIPHHPAYCGWHHSLARGPKLCKSGNMQAEKKKKTSEQPRVHLFLSALGCAWDVTRCSNFLHVLPHNDGLGAGTVSQINLSSSMLLFSFFCQNILWQQQKWNWGPHLFRFFFPHWGWNYAC